MAKRKKAKPVESIGYSWIETEEGFCPIIHVGKMRFQLEARPSRMFLKGEREALMFQIGNEAMKELFNVRRFIPNEHGHLVEDPLWKELEVLEPEPENTIVGLNGEPVTSNTSNQ